MRAERVRWVQRGHAMYGLSTSGTVYRVTPVLPRSGRERLSWRLKRGEGRALRTIGEGFSDTGSAMEEADRLEARKGRASARASRR